MDPKIASWGVIYKKMSVFEFRISSKMDRNLYKSQILRNFAFKKVTKIMKKIRDIDFDTLIPKIQRVYVSGARFQNYTVRNPTFLNNPKNCHIFMAILEKSEQLSKKWTRKQLLKVKMYQKMSLVDFRKWSKMGRNFHKGAVFEKLAEKIRKYSGI